MFNYTYDVLGRKTSVAAAIGSSDDYVNTYSYDNLGRITQITQDGVTGGNAVAEKRVDFGYSDDGARATISRFADLAGAEAVAETESIFDELGRITDIVHERAASAFADYDFTWDAAGRISDFDFGSLVGDDGDATYSYDDTNQLTGSDYASDWQDDESYVYDDNGNRTLVDGSTSYTTGDHNRLTSDGTYNYTYDGEGNVLTKTNISTSDSVEYTWDHRNRLTKVTFKNSGGTATKIVEYAYDFGQRWVRKTLDTNADGTIEESRMFVHDNGQIVLDFEKTGTSAASNSDLAHRYLWGNSVDQLLADETVDDATEDDTAWALTDHLNSVRDLVEYNSGTVSVIKHVTYDAFGQETSDSAPTIIMLHGFTARPFDPDTGNNNNGFRWYDLSTGRWMSVDPIGFDAGDVNLYRYVGNSTPWQVDPLGLVDQSFFDYAGVFPIYHYIVTTIDGFNIALTVYENQTLANGAALTMAQESGVFEFDSIVVSNEFVPDENGFPVHSPGMTYSSPTLVIMKRPLEEIDGLCYPRYLIAGFIVSLVAPSPDDRYTELEFEGHPPNADALTNYLLIYAHERDHFTTLLTAYREIITAFEGHEGQGYADANLLLADQHLYEAEAHRVWAVAQAHSLSFDQPPWNVGGTYYQHPLPTYFWHDD